MPNITPTLTIPQANFLALPHKFTLFVGGYGSGKTWTLGSKACKHYWENPGIHRGYFAPTYSQIRDIYYPTIEEVAHDWGLRVDIKESNKEVHFYNGRTYRGTTICRSMEKPGTIVGFKVGEADVDEIDTLPIKKATDAWRKIIARIRLKYDGPNGVAVGTTPEGFRFAYQQWVKAPLMNPEIRTLYGMVQASTYDNELYLPDGYIDSLLLSYPPALIAAYLNGEFTNLTSGTIYNTFNRFHNGTDATHEQGEALHIGMDFNVGKMAAITHVIRDSRPLAVDELVDVFDTPKMIEKLKERYWSKKQCPITIYPDASGGSRRSVNASTSDIQLLRDAGFKVKAPDANPPVKDRILAMNAAFCNSLGLRNYRVNVDTCPNYTSNLEQQAWDEKTQEPDKKGGFDHTNDAGGYFIHSKWPVVKQSARVFQLPI
jgi:hypothetical protein